MPLEGARSRAACTAAGKSCLMQDEPGGRGCFACKMSLERGSAMLGIDDQSEQQTGNEPGRDPGFFESQRSRAFRRREKGGGLRLGERVPGEQNWDALGRTARALLRRYMEKMTGVSRAQITRLITRYGEDGDVRVKRRRRHRFAPLYSHQDVALLLSVDEAHETLSGPATQKILQRQCYDFGDQRYDRLARISVAQIYRLRKSAGYRKQRVVYQCT